MNSIFKTIFTICGGRSGQELSFDNFHSIENKFDKAEKIEILKYSRSVHIDPWKYVIVFFNKTFYKIYLFVSQKLKFSEIFKKLLNDWTCSRYFGRYEEKVKIFTINNNIRDAQNLVRLRCEWTYKYNSQLF